MQHRHSNKTISFLMELIFVLLFFTIASAISVFVIVNAKEKNEHALALRQAMVYGENMINAEDEDIRSFLTLDQFYFQEDGTPIEHNGYYKVIITRNDIDGLPNGKKCNMKILLNGKKLVEIAFFQKGAAS